MFNSRCGDEQTTNFDIMVEFDLSDFIQLSIPKFGVDKFQVDSDFVLLLTHKIDNKIWTHYSKIFKKGVDQLFGKLIFI